MNGLLAVADALFQGHFEAPDYDATISAYASSRGCLPSPSCRFWALPMRCRPLPATISAPTAVLAAFGYCLTLQIGMSVFAAPIGLAFVSHPVVDAEVARILR